MNKWSKLAPHMQGWYWHWNGDEDTAPFMFHVLKSGTNGECFISGGQGGLKGPVWCKDYGGWWKKQNVPNVPLETLDNPCFICNKEECMSNQDWCHECCE